MSVGASGGLTGSAIAVANLAVAYTGRPALAEVSFEVPRGALVGVLGPNGGGKTTLLRALLGTVSYTGSVVVNGPTAYVPQLPAVQASFPVDALGVVLMGRYARLGWLRPPGAADRRHALSLLERVGLLERARSPFGVLSGGQRQRALVARALAQDGEVLLLDEPLTGIDAPSQETVLSILREERERGRTVCLTTHDLAQAARVCDRLVLLDRTLIAEGTARQVLRPEVLARAYGRDFLRVDGYAAVVDDAHH